MREHRRQLEGGGVVRIELDGLVVVLDGAVVLTFGVVGQTATSQRQKDHLRKRLEAIEIFAASLWDGITSGPRQSMCMKARL
jgi:hypothetical protein